MIQPFWPVRRMIEFLQRFAVGLAGLIALPAASHSAEVAEVMQRGSYVSHECRILSDLKGFTPAADVKLSRYGGWLERRAEATGFFHPAELDGRWWVIDPEGHVFLSVGVNSVSPASPKPAEAPSPEDLLWGEQTLAGLRNHAFNTLGCWSAAEIVRKLPQPMPYCLRWGFMSGYRKERRARHPATGEIPAIYPFDPEFESFCDQVAQGMAETKDDPWLFGHFSDNELPLHEWGIVERYLSHPTDDPNHKAAAAFMASRGDRKPTKEDDRDFLRLVVDTYYAKVAAAIRKHDPNHMFLGSRFHGKALTSSVIFEAGGRHADIISVNYYHRWTPENDRIRNWAKVAGKPILLTEWYAMSSDGGLPTDVVGAGFPVRTQQDRAKFYEHFTLTLLENPGCVGWHWFRYRDGTNNAGMVNAEEKPYGALWEAMKRVNTQVYPLAEFLQPVIPHVSPKSHAIRPQERPSKWWQDRNAGFNDQAARGGFDVLFAGDSITQGWENKGKEIWAAQIAPLKAANFGISGDRTEHLLWRFQNGNLDGDLDPKVLVLMVGTNNNRRKDLPEDIAAGVGAILETFHARFPKARILLLAIFPRGESPTDPMRVNNDATNELLAKYDGHWNVKYVNINPTFLAADGTLSREVMPDLLHLSPQGYQTWADAIVPEIKGVLEAEKPSLSP